MEILDEVVNEEKDVEKIFDDAPVYVLESSIPDVLALNELKKQIEEKDKEKKEQEDEIAKDEEQRNALVEQIGIINNGQHINKVRTNLTELRALDEKLFTERAQVEDIYGALNDLNDDYNSLDESTREMVNKMTAEYNDLTDRYHDAVESYTANANFSYYQLALDIADELNTYKVFENFDAILEGKELDEDKEEKTEEKDENVEETPVEEPVQEKEEETELSEVKVDALPEAEAPVEEKSEEVAPVEETPIPQEEDKIEMPSFEELMAKAKEAEQQAVQEEKAEVTPIVENKPEEVAPVQDAPVVETPAAEAPVAETPEVKKDAELKIEILTSKNDKIAETDRAKVTGIEEVFSKKPAVQDKTLVYAA
ncbi:MAG: hypothetical protein IKZ96_03115 [Bacilli bacterium]|nr:hypothetical protein [Bacilli bacterium]